MKTTFNAEKPDIMYRYYMSTICHVCKMPTNKRCSKCLLFAYCSAEHQKVHWPHHKAFCKTIAVIRGKREHIYDRSKVHHMTVKEWEELLLFTTRMIRQSMPLSSSETDALVTPRVCEICRLAKQKQLFDCQICYSSSYCSVEHKMQHFSIHDKYCLELKLRYDFGKEMSHGLWLSQIDVKDVVDLPTDMETWLTNYAIVKPISLFQKDPKLCDVFLQVRGYCPDTCNPTSIVAHGNLLASQTFSPILTIIYAMKASKMVYGKKLTIHLIGTRSYEAEFNYKLFFKIISKLFPKIKCMHVVLVGPEATELTVKNRSLNISTTKLLYHVYVASESYKAPAIMVMFNCGFFEFENTPLDTWGETLKCLNGLVMFTSYTEQEALSDFKRINAAEVLIRSQKNPYGCRIPIQSFPSNDPQVSYANNYVSVIRK